MLTSFLSAVFWGLLIMSLLVVVHEGGHFFAARFFGIRVTEFFLGLPFRWNLSVKSRRFGTEFGVTPILLGGYNRICGMEHTCDEDVMARALALIQERGRMRADDLARELGVSEDEVYAVLPALVDLAAIRPYYDPELGEVPWQREWPAAFETLERDGKLSNEYDADHDFSEAGTTKAGEARPVDDPRGFLEHEEARSYRGKGALERIVLLCAGPLVNILTAFLLVVGSLMIAGVETLSDSNTLAEVVEGSYAETAGLKAGDTIVQIGSDKISSWADIEVAIDHAVEQRGSIPVAYLRGGETYETTLELPKDEEIELVGVVREVEIYHPTVVEAGAYAIRYVTFVGSRVAQIIMPQHTMEVVGQSSSIVGISQMASEAASSGVNDLVLFAAAISLSLGFMNLLPIPPLDGGKIVIELVQVVLRRPLSVKAQNALSYLGLAFVLFIFCFALRNDVVRLLGL